MYICMPRYGVEKGKCLGGGHRTDRYIDRVDQPQRTVSAWPQLSRWGKGLQTVL